MPRRMPTVPNEFRNLVKSKDAAITKAAQAYLTNARPSLPRLWNAKRRIKSGRILASKGDVANERKRLQLEAVHLDKNSQAWKKLVSEDVIKFIEDAKLPFKERRACVANPNAYFSYPNNVPDALRKQVFFPKFTITLKRTPNLPPKYAAFKVPLWFNKLDMKDYLRSVYGVEVLHVRSVVFQASVRRRETKSKYTNGALYRPTSTKKMIVELVDPFVWPEVVKDLTPWDKDTYYSGMQFSIEENAKREESVAQKPNKSHRKSIAQQAKELLTGRTAWKPTWESMSTDSRILKPFDPRKPGVVANSRTAGRSFSAPR